MRTPRTSSGKIHSLSGANLHQTPHCVRLFTSTGDLKHPRILSESVVFWSVETSVSEVSVSRPSAMGSG